MVDHIDPTAYVPPPVAPVGGQSGYAGRHPQQNPEEHHRSPAVDVATVLAATEQAMSPAMQDCFLELVEHVERLREELERVRKHETYLVNNADRHPGVPAFHRRAFMAGLNRLLEASERADLPGSLALLHIVGLETLRVTYGLVAQAAALTFVAEEIATELRQTDLLGYLDGSDFVLALAVAETDGARAKIDRIAATLSATPFVWRDKLIPLDVRLGVVHFEAGMTPESALAAADQAIMSGTSELSSIAI
jgi:PleD family two-component response regulator